jgi:hypothetical protein
MNRFSPKLWLTVIALALLVGLLAPPVGASGRQLRVQLDEPFAVGGEYFMGGELTLRELREFNPVSTLTELRVDGRSLGVVLARSQADGPAATRDEVIFERSSRGHLVLASVAVKGEPVRKLYRLGQGEGAGQWHALSARRPTMVAALK